MKRRKLNYSDAKKFCVKEKYNATKADLPFKLESYFCGENQKLI